MGNYASRLLFEFDILKFEQLPCWSHHYYLCRVAVYAIATRTHELIKNADTRSYVRKSIKVNELREMLS